MSAHRAVVLAAGASERLGQPKPLVPVPTEGGEVPLVRWMVERLEAADVEVVVVTRQELVVDVMLALPGRAIVINPNPEAGRTGTLQCGIKALLDSKRTPKELRVLVVPVDRPGFSDSTLGILLEAEECCCPSKDGRGGHPLRLMPEDLENILRAGRDIPLRDLVSPLKLIVSDAHLHLNLDSPDDLGPLSEFIASRA